MALVQTRALGTAWGWQVTQVQHQLGRCLTRVARARQAIGAQVRCGQRIGGAGWQCCGNRAGNRLDIGVGEIDGDLDIARHTISPRTDSTNGARRHADRKYGTGSHAVRHAKAVACQRGCCLHKTPTVVTVSRPIAGISGVHQPGRIGVVLGEPGQRCIIGQGQ